VIGLAAVKRAHRLLFARLSSIAFVKFFDDKENVTSVTASAFKNLVRPRLAGGADYCSFKLVAAFRRLVTIVSAGFEFLVVI